MISDTGATGGGTIDMGESDTVFFTGALITQYNTKYIGDKISTVYLTVPAQGKTFFNEGQRSGPFIRYGVNVNILLSAQQRKSDGSRENLKDSQNILDVQGAVGAGLAIPLDVGLVIDVSFARSLVSLARAKSSTIYNQTVMLNAGIALQ